MAASSSRPPDFPLIVLPSSAIRFSSRAKMSKASSTFVGLIFELMQSWPTVMMFGCTTSLLSRIEMSVSSTIAYLFWCVVHGPMLGVISAVKLSVVKGFMTGFGAAAFLADLRIDAA